MFHVSKLPYSTATWSFKLCDKKYIWLKSFFNDIVDKYIRCMAFGEIKVFIHFRYKGKLHVHSYQLCVY
jgi:hypothetical protein